MRVNLNIQWGYTFFLTWHCKTNYFKYKLCLVYNYMERYLFMLLWSTRKSFWMFFFFSWDCCLGVAQPKPRKGGNSQLRPLKVITRHLFLLHHNPTFSCIFCCPCMFYAAFILFGQMMWWCGASVRFPFRLFLICGKTHLEPLLSKPLKHTRSGLTSVGNQSLFFFFLLIWRVRCWRISSAPHRSSRRYEWLWMSLRILSLQCCGFVFLTHQFRPLSPDVDH